MKKLGSIVALGLIFVFGNSFAQTLSVEKQDGNRVVYQLNDISAIHFPSGTMEVRAKSGEVASFNLLEIQNLNFNEVTVVVSPSEKQAQPLYYPNPAKDVLWVEWNASNQDAKFVEVYSLEGKLVIKEQYQGSESRMRIDVARLKQGIYLVKLRAGSEINTFKFKKD